ncbi:MAG: DUF1320 domain-containing protein [Pseudomonadota bacterium]
MSYAVPSDIRDAWGERIFLALADEDADGQADAARLAPALAAASAEIDGYVGARHRLPLPSRPEQLRRPCVDIAVYRLATNGSLVTEEMRQRYEDAVAFLDKVAKGMVVLDVVDPNADPEDATAGQGARPIVSGGPERIFTRQGMSEL